MMAFILVLVLLAAVVSVAIVLALRRRFTIHLDRLDAEIRKSPEKRGEVPSSKTDFSRFPRPEPITFPLPFPGTSTRARWKPGFPSPIWSSPAAR